MQEDYVIVFYLSRRKNYEIYGKVSEEPFRDETARVLLSVNHVEIQEEGGVYQQIYSFPNVTELTLHDSFTASHRALSVGLNRILSLQRIKIFTIRCRRLRFEKMICLLSYVPNVQTITVESIFSDKNERESIHQYQQFQLLSQKNRITSVTVEQKRALDVITLFVKLFPRVQSLSIDIMPKDMKSIFELLSNKNVPNLLLLCFNFASKACFRQLNGLISSKVLPSDYKVAHIDEKLYLW